MSPYMSSYMMRRQFETETSACVTTFWKSISMPTPVGKIFTFLRVGLVIKIMLVHTTAVAGFCSIAMVLSHMVSSCKIQDMFLFCRGIVVYGMFHI